MGQTTPNLQIYIPSEGEKNYGTSFLAGMTNVDQHDHSGAPNKGVPLVASGITDGAITINKLNANVVLAGGGLDVLGTPPLPLRVDAPLLSLNSIAANGFVAHTAANTFTPRTLTGTANEIAITNPTGAGGDPVFSLIASPSFMAYPSAAISSVTGAGTDYSVIFDSEQYSSLGAYDITTGIFTAPQTGIYNFSSSVTFRNLTNAMLLGYLILRTTNALGDFVLCRNNPWEISDNSAYSTYGGSVCCKLVAGQTAKLVFNVTGGAGDTVTILGAANPTSWFSGSRIK